MDRRGSRRQGGHDPRMDRRGPDFGYCPRHGEYSLAQDFDDDDMGPSRHSTRDGPSGRGGAGPYNMSDPMDDDMDITPRGGHDRHHGSTMTPREEYEYKSQLALLQLGNMEALRRHGGGPRRNAYQPQTHSMGPHPSHGRGGSGADQDRFMPSSSMLSGSHPPHVGGGGPRGSRGESLDEYIDGEEERYGGGHGHGGGGGPSHGRDRGESPDENRDLDIDEYSEDEDTNYPPRGSGRRHGHESRRGGGGYGLH